MNPSITRWLASQIGHATPPKPHSRNRRRQKLVHELLENRRLLAGLQLTPVLVNTASFDIDDYAGQVSSHASAAVSEAKLAVIDETGWASFNRDGTVDSTTDSLDAFWTTAINNAGGATVVDDATQPRLLFDATANRWFATAVHNQDAVDSGLLVAVTVGADPSLANWRGFSLDADTADVRWASAPQLGFDADGLYLTATMLDISGVAGDETTETTLWGLPKADLLADPPTVTNAEVVANVMATMGPTAQPMVHPQGTLPHPMLSTFDANSLRLSELPNDFFTAPAVSNTATLAAPSTDPPLGRQAGANDNLLASDTAFRSSVVQQGNSIWGVRSVAFAGRSAIEWVRIDATSNTLINRGILSDTQFDFYAPSIAVDVNQRVVIGMSGSSETTPIGAFVVVGTTADDVTTFGEITNIQAGQGNFLNPSEPPNQWSSFSTTVVDPMAPNAFVTAQQVASADNAFAVHVAQFTLVDQATLTGSPGDDAFRIVRNAATPENVDLFVNDVLVGSLPLATTQGLTIEGLAGNDVLTIDSSNGLIGLEAGIRFDGGAGIDEVRLEQTGGATEIISESIVVGATAGAGMSLVESPVGMLGQILFFENIEPFSTSLPAATFSILAAPPPLFPSPPIASLLADDNQMTVTDGSIAGQPAGLVTVDFFEPIQFRNKTAVTIEAGAGDDLVVLDHATRPTGLDTLVVSLGSGNDEIRLLQTPEDVAVEINGNGGDDRLDAAALTGPALQLNGNAGNDVIVGRAGADTVSGGDGDDTLLFLGTSGSDVLSLNQTAADQLEYVVDFAGGAIPSMTLTPGDIELIRIEAGAGADVLAVTAADGLANPIPIEVDGGSSAGGNRLLVQDDGQGDLVLAREGADGSSGRVTIGPLNAAPHEIQYRNIERVEYSQAGGLSDGAVVILKPDRFEGNDTQANAAALPAAPTVVTDLSIDAGTNAGVALPPPFNALSADTDWFRFQATRSGAFRFQLQFTELETVASGRPGLPDSGRLALEVRDASGTVLVSNPNNPANAQDISLTAGQTVFVRVAGVDANSDAAVDAVNRYELAITEVIDHSVAKLGVWGGGSVYIDMNRDGSFEPNNSQPLLSDHVFTLGLGTDHVFNGVFSAGADGIFGNADDAAGTPQGLFDRIGAYGVANGAFRFLLDFDNDGVPDEQAFAAPDGIRGIPVAGNFNGIAEDGDEVGVFDGSRWYLDVNRNFTFEPNEIIETGIRGLPVVGDFNGDGNEDLATYDPVSNQFFVSISAGAFPNAVETHRFRLGNGMPFLGVRDRPVAGDLNGDGIDDIGIWVPDRSGLDGNAEAEWYFLVSNPGTATSWLDPSRLTADFSNGEQVISFTPQPFGQDRFFRFGSPFALPLVGNFDPPVTASTATSEPPAPALPVLESSAVLQEEPIAEEPVAEEPIAEEPIAEEPIAEAPVAEEPVAEEPTAEEPTAEDLVVEDLVVEDLVVEDLVVEELVVEELVAEAPVAVQEISSPAAVEPASEIRWRHNAANPVDVDGDGRVFPRDALLVVNALLAYFGGPNRLPAPDHETAASVDVSGNGTLEPRDALLVLNALIELAKQNQVSGGSSFQADSRSVGPSGEAARTVDGTERLLDASAVKASPWQQAPPIELAAERVDPVFGSYGSEVSASTEWLVRHDVSANRLH